jgi:protein ImuA
MPDDFVLSQRRLVPYETNAHKHTADSSISLGIGSLDDFLRGGLARGEVHEIYAAHEADASAATGLMLAFARMVAGAGSMVWVRQDFLETETGQLYAPGLVEFGLDPAGITYVRARDTLGALQAGLDAARCSSLGAVLIELWGEARAFDLTASRRLALAAEASGVTVLMTRIAASPQPSAAATRWQVRAAPSQGLPANAPGNPAFSITLLRQRHGPAGQQWHLEWNRDRGCLEDRSIAGSIAIRSGHAPSLSGGLVSISGDRPGAVGSRQANASPPLHKAG